MIRPLTIATFLLACGSGLYLYQSKHEAQVLDRTIAKTVQDTAALREQSRRLAAEWTMLNDPDTLRHFADSYLALKTVTPGQFTSLADLDSRLPPVPQPASMSDSDEDGPVAATDPASPAPASTATGGTVADTAPGAAPPAAARPSIASVHVPERKVAGVRMPAADGAARPAATAERSTTVVAAAPRTLASVEPRASGQHSTDARPSDRYAVQTAEAHAAEVKVAELPPPVVLSPAQPPPRSVAPRPAASRPEAAHTPPPAGLPPAHSGSLLGMAHGPGMSPLPRPTPVNATQWLNSN